MSIDLVINEPEYKISHLSRIGNVFQYRNASDTTVISRVYLIRNLGVYYTLRFIFITRLQIFSARLSVAVCHNAYIKPFHINQKKNTMLVNVDLLF